MTAIRRRRPSPRLVLAAGVLGLAGVVVIAAAVMTPAPRRPAPVTGSASDRPGGNGTAAPSGSPILTMADLLDPSDPAPTPEVTPPATPGPTTAATPAATPGPTTAATPAATPEPAARVPVDLDIVRHPNRVFAHEIKVTWCASAGVQMTLAILGLGDTSRAFQREIQGRVGRWDSYADSHNGRWGPTAMTRALAAYGAKGYEVRVYNTRQGALRAAARAIVKTGAPVILLAWRGAHTWVMTGFRADADPAVFSDATIKGAYILDPWYPSVSSIWGPSDPPGTFQNNAEMVRNYLRWKRPEGKYPGRDGKFIVVVPTVRVGPAD